MEQRRVIGELRFPDVSCTCGICNIRLKFFEPGAVNVNSLYIEDKFTCHCGRLFWRSVDRAVHQISVHRQEFICQNCSDVLDAKEEKQPVIYRGEWWFAKYIRINPSFQVQEQPSVEREDIYANGNRGLISVDSTVSQHDDAQEFTKETVPPSMLVYRDSRAYSTDTGPSSLNLTSYEQENDSLICGVAGLQDNNTRDQIGAGRADPNIEWPRSPLPRASDVQPQNGSSQLMRNRTARREVSAQRTSEGQTMIQQTWTPSHEPEQRLNNPGDSMKGSKHLAAKGGMKRAGPSKGKEKNKKQQKPSNAVTDGPVAKHEAGMQNELADGSVAITQPSLNKEDTIDEESPIDENRSPERVSKRGKLSDNEGSQIKIPKKNKKKNKAITATQMYTASLREDYKAKLRDAKSSLREAKNRRKEQQDKYTARIQGLEDAKKKLLEIQSRIN